jgi:hypothetical protein
MGLLTTYCKKCDNNMSAFGTDDSGGMTCPSCGVYNTKEDVCNALFKPEYHPKIRKIKEHRANVAKKIKDMLNGTN